MTTTTSASPVIDDDRKKSTSRFHDLMIRPEFGAVIAAIAMFAFFAFIAPVILQPSSISTVLYGASTIGIMAVGVSLLMIGGEDRKSTRLNSSHVAISYAVFCLKKQN